MPTTEPEFTCAPILPPAPSKPGRRPLGRRILRGAAIGLTSIVGLVALVLVLLQTPWGKSFVRGRIEAKLAAKVNGSVSLGSIDYSFLFGEIRLGGVQISDASGRPAVRLGSLRAELDRGSLLAGAPVIDELELAGVDVVVVQSADGKSNLTGLFKPSTSKPLARIRISRLTVSGAATVTKPDGTTIAVRDLSLGGALDARPAAKELDATLRALGAHVIITVPGAAPRNVAVAIDSIAVGRRADAVDLDVGKIVVGALGVGSLGAHLRLDGGHLKGAQSIKLAGLRLDDQELASLLGHKLLVDDLAVDVSITGPEHHLTVGGEVRIGGARLSLDGTVDVSAPARPRYQLAVVGTGLRSDLIETRGKRPPLVETTLRIDLAGAGISPVDLEAHLGIAIGPTKIGELAIDGLTATASARRGAYQLEHLQASAPGLDIEADGALGADKTVSGRVTVRGVPSRVARTLAAAGIALPKRVPLPPRLDLAITAAGNLDGTVTVELEPTRLKIAGGEVALSGRASLEHRLVQSAATKIGIHALDLGEIQRLAGKQPKLVGSVSGTIDLLRTATSQRCEYDLAVALRDLGLDVTAKGTAAPTALTSRIEAVRASDRAVVATIAAELPLTRRAGKPVLRTTGDWHVGIDVAHRSFAELTALLPEHLRRQLPQGDVELHVDLAGTPERPIGSIDLAMSAAALPHATQKVSFHGALSSSDRGLALATTGSVSLRDDQGPIAILGGTITAPAPLAGGKLDVAALRAGATIDAVIDLPERELASLAFLRAKLAEIGGRLDGRVAVRGSIDRPQLDAEVRVRGYPTAAGGAGSTTITAHGTPAAITAELRHGDAIAITAAIDRATSGRIGVGVKARATDAPLLSTLPAFLAGKLGKHDPGRLRWDMTGTFALVRGTTGLALEQASLTGTLDVKGGVFAVPNSTRRWHDIDLAIASEPTGLRIKSLVLHESDLAVADRRIDGSGFVTWDRLRPQQISLALAAHDWLLFGTPSFGPSDAPRATADFDLDVDVDLRSPVVAVDATVRELALRSPDRFDRGHQPELASASGDVIYLDASSARAGKLPVAVRPAEPSVAATPRHRRPIDVRIHIPNPIRVEQAPLDVTARGEIAVTVRDAGVTTRGGLTLESGALSVFGHDYKLAGGNFQFTDEHPHGWLDVTFVRPLPPAVMRELSLVSAGGGARMTLTGAPATAKKSLGGASNAGLAEAMAINNTGHTVYVSAPDLPASATVVAPRGDQLPILTFMASNLPHLLFLDRVTAWADPYHSSSAYGRIENVEAERYSRDQRSRVRALVRPPTPGRSSAELQWDRLLINDDRTAVGVGVRAGSRVGGGVGVFVEWSSDD